MDELANKFNSIRFLILFCFSKYIIVYFHNGVPFLESKQIKFLKKIYEGLPQKYFSNMIQFYIVSPSLTLKSKLFLGFSFVNSFLKLKIIYLNEYRKNYIIKVILIKFD